MIWGSMAHFKSTFFFKDDSSVQKDQDEKPVLPVLISRTVSVKNLLNLLIYHII